MQLGWVVFPTAGAKRGWRRDSVARGGGDSVSLTSEVVADTKCRQELVEVMLKPWGGDDRRDMV